MVDNASPSTLAAFLLAVVFVKWCSARSARSLFLLRCLRSYKLLLAVVFVKWCSARSARSLFLLPSLGGHRLSVSVLFVWHLFRSLRSLPFALKKSLW